MGGGGLGNFLGHNFFLTLRLCMIFVSVVGNCLCNIFFFKHRTWMVGSNCSFLSSMAPLHDFFPAVFAVKLDSIQSLIPPSKKNNGPFFRLFVSDDQSSKSCYIINDILLAS